MKGLGAVMLYLIIGGMFAGWTDNFVRERCQDYRMSDQVFISIATLWPAGIGFVVISNDTRETECRSAK